MKISANNISIKSMTQQYDELRFTYVQIALVLNVVIQTISAGLFLKCDCEVFDFVW